MTKKIKYTWETVPMQDVPQGIRTHLNKHFSQDVVFGIVKEQDKNSNDGYTIDVDHNTMVHHIRFDIEGIFISEKVEATAETDEEHHTTVGTGD